MECEMPIANQLCLVGIVTCPEPPLPTCMCRCYACPAWCHDVFGAPCPTCVLTFAGGDNVGARPLAGGRLFFSLSLSLSLSLPWIGGAYPRSVWAQLGDRQAFADHIRCSCLPFEASAAQSVSRNEKFSLARAAVCHSPMSALWFPLPLAADKGTSQCPRRI